MTKDYLRTAANYGKTGTVGHTQAEDTADQSPNDGNLPFARPKVQVDRVLQSRAPVWAVLDLECDPAGVPVRSRVLSSSGNPAFDAHVLQVVAGTLPGLPELPDGGLGIHSQGTHSVWQVEGHLTFERDIKSFDVKKDAWYVPIAALTALAGATGAAFDEVSGHVAFNDFRHPRVSCQVKLLQVY